MAQAKHTPGPWTMQTVRTSVGVCFKVGPFPWKRGQLNHACIYADYPSSSEHAECLANASLIAAAPDLLAALIEYMRVCPADEDMTPAFQAATNAARAAIAKAHGEPQ